MAPMQALGWDITLALIKQGDQNGMNNQCSTHQAIIHRDPLERPHSTRHRWGLHSNHHLEVPSATPLVGTMT